MRDAFRFLTVKCPFFVPSNVMPAIRSQRERDDFGGRCRTPSATGAGRTIAPSDNGIPCRSPAPPSVPLHLTGLCIHSSDRPSNLACQGERERAPGATGSPLRRAPGGQAPRCHRCPSTRALPPSQGRSASCETHVWVVKIHNPPPAPCTQELYLRPPCRKSRPLQRLTTHSGGFPAQ